MRSAAPQSHLPLHPECVLTAQLRQITRERSGQCVRRRVVGSRGGEMSPSGPRGEIPVDFIYVSYSIEKRTGQHDWLVSFPNRRTDSLVDTIFNIFASLAWPAVPSVVKFLGQGLLCFWHRLDQQRERLAEA